MIANGNGFSFQVDKCPKIDSSAGNVHSVNIVKTTELYTLRE